MSTPEQSNSPAKKPMLLLLTVTALGVGVVCYTAFGTNKNAEPITESATTTQPGAAVVTDDKRTPGTHEQIASSIRVPENDDSNRALAISTGSMADNNADQPSVTDIARENQAVQTQYLREVLPDNDLIPFERTPQEVETMMAEFQEHSALQKKIEAGEATETDQLRFYELRASKLEDEIELIKLCQDVQANTLDADEETAPTLCANATAKGSQRLQQLEEMLAELEHKYL
ncbi:hypothetical protein FT643_05460 [Ketobacter sp. MCCC 1A13808]|uniref:hypothetical protein n=1 Tax=Ketobacter sp. MCCC 1A13808 TaxID=2602738 RepID=UPI000F2C0BE4|nr:hypothetical protein [Ketobacter sp. MCCC 1A13808]MVF11588.1 hypothetical protein [Ketobacter sp. MCCC 1A13808]RLP55202.1 MAG: hypothetical protein D6160_05460 [Ketobacter sp.]